MDTEFGVGIEYSNQDYSVLDTSEACRDAIGNFNDSWGNFSDTFGSWIDSNNVTTGDLVSSAMDAYADHGIYTEVCDVGSGWGLL